MEHSIKTIYSLANISFVVKGEHGTQRLKHFRESVLQGHLSGYLSRKLLLSPDYFQDLRKPALSVLLEGHLMRARETSWPIGWRDTLQCLLAAGQDPNQEYREFDNSNQHFTPWTSFCSIVISWSTSNGAQESSWFISTIHNGLFSLFLENGANPNALVLRPGPVFSTAWVDMLQMSFEVSIDRLDEDLYLQELNAFLRHGAKVDAAATTPIISNEFVSSGELAYEAFFSRLTPCIKSGKCNVRLLEQVTRILLGKMQDSRIELDWALEKTSTALAPAKFQQLRSDFPTGEQAVGVANKKRKKRGGGKSSVKRGRR